MAPERLQPAPAKARSRRESRTCTGTSKAGLTPDDMGPSNLFDLEGKSLTFVPDAAGNYAHTVGPLASLGTLCSGALPRGPTSEPNGEYLRQSPRDAVARDRG